jgi:hypothetical protein
MLNFAVLILFNQRLFEPKGQRLYFMSTSLSLLRVTNYTSVTLNCINEAQIAEKMYKKVRHALMRILFRRYIFGFFICLTTLSLLAQPLQSKIPIEITQVNTYNWLKGGGVFRAIQSNSEIDPCLTVESIDLQENQVHFSRSVCPDDLTVLDFFDKGRHLQMEQENAGFYWEHIHFSENVMTVQFEVFLLRGSAFMASCPLMLDKHGMHIGGCVLIPGKESQG